MTTRSAGAGIVAVVALMLGCHHAMAPKLRYSMPPLAVLPVSSAGLRDASNQFGATFCSVFEEFKSQEHRGCYQYFRDSQPTQPAPAPLLASDRELQGYRFVLVNGFMSGCVSSGSFQVFGDADSHLASHGVTLERIPLEGMDTPEADAEQIVRYLESSSSAADSRPIVFLGYSKGAVDLQATILRIQQSSALLQARVQALITVAGAVGGSRLYDQVAGLENISALLSHFRFFDCPAGKRDFRSLSRQQRQNFLHLHWRKLSIVPTYALTTVSTPEETSRVLRPFWQQLSVYGIEQDSQMAQPEQIPPGAVYLGIARADHWAVALPLEHDRRLSLFADKNHYPRTAMLEALLRFVVADLRRDDRTATAEPLVLVR